MKCPNCGYCPHCGRANAPQPWPVQPYGRIWIQKPAPYVVGGGNAANPPRSGRTISFNGGGLH